MVKIFQETTESNFEGTIIDLETIGSFQNHDDSRRYKQIIPVIFGLINNKEIKILCAKNSSSIQILRSNILDIIDKLDRPFYAFNSPFEKGVLLNHLSRPIEFEKELNKEKFEKKEHIVRALNIPNYDDPFFGDGHACMMSWLRGDINKAILHNRSCLLKERDILLKRGFRKPDELKIVL
jgi:hypothetical protein